MIRVGLLGFGFSGRCFHAPFFGPAGLDFAAVATSRGVEVQARWPGVETAADAKSVIARSDIDLIVVATPNDSHAPLTLHALKAGKHVVVDKPMALDTAEAQAMVQAAKDADRSLFVFHNRRWDSDFLTVRRMLEAGELGRVYAYEGHFNRYAPEGLGRWRGAPGPGSGLLADLGPHLVDQALALFGRPDWIWADIAKPRATGTADEAFLLRLAFGEIRATLAASLFVGDVKRRAVTHGEAGSLIITGRDAQEGHLIAGRGPDINHFGRFEGRAELRGPDGVREVATDTGCYLSFYRGVRSTIEDGALPPVTVEEALAVMRVLDAARASAAEGRRMPLG